MAGGNGTAAAAPANSCRLAAGLVAVVYLAVVASAMVTDVWDEGRALNLVFGHSVVELVTTNWQQRAAGGVVLFRPLPFLLVTAVAKGVGDFELSWRLLRALNGLLLVATTWLLVDVRRRLCGPDPLRDLLLAAGVLWSGGAVIAGGWFATIFDVATLLAIVCGLAALARGRGLTAGAAFGAAFFCKEIAILALPLVAALRWAGRTPRRASDQALVVAGSAALVYGVLRLLVVAPGSAADVRSWSLAGTAKAFWQLPETIWWQVADPPLPGIGLLATALVLATVRPLRLSAGAGAVCATAAVVYGEMVHVQASPLLDADNFIGRLHLVPAALLLLLVAVGGRRVVLAALVVPLVWGAGLTLDRHLRFQRAYLRVYELAAAAENPPLLVDSPLYRGAERFDHEARRLVFGVFPSVCWRLELDGTLVDRCSAAPASQPVPD